MKKIKIMTLLLGGLAVMAGAFGSHVLFAENPGAIQGAYDTAVKYQFWHVLALLILLFGQVNAISVQQKKLVALLFISGILMFSGSLYFITIFKILQWDFPYFVVFVTPAGGTLLIAAWLFWAYYLIKSGDSAQKNSKK